MTETLSTLTRDQLQKLLQYAINEDPGGVLGRVFQHIGIHVFGFIIIYNAMESFQISVQILNLIQ